MHSSGSSETKTESFVAKLVRDSKFLSTFFWKNCNNVINLGETVLKIYFSKGLRCGKIHEPRGTQSLEGLEADGLIQIEEAYDKLNRVVNEGIRGTTY